MNSARLARIRAALQVLGVEDEPMLRPLAGGAGGSMGHVALLESAGRRFFVKWLDAPLEGAFDAEARGLEALRGSGTSLRIPRVLGHADVPADESFLLLEHVETGTRARGFEEALGRGLALLHRHTSRRGFGFECPTYCGRTLQPNAYYTGWVDFYREQRLGHQLELARQNGLPRGDAALVDRLLARLDEWLSDDERPALIHGDLWAGNLLCDERETPTLVDPAAYFAHREAEFGMMTLFGGFSRRVYDSYHEAFPLRPGWADRVDLYTLYHLLNHFNLFGGAYALEAMAIVRRYVG